MFTIARNELFRLFLSPIAWVFLGLSLTILAYLFLTHVDNFVAIQAKISAIPGAPGVTELIISPIFSNAATVLLLTCPFITMRLIAEERRNDSLCLLLSAPLSSTQIVLGKYLGTALFFLLWLLLVSLMPLSLLMGSAIDLGVLFTNFIGLFLLVTTFIAIGLYLSSLTKQPTVAAISTFSTLFLLWILDWAGNQSNLESNTLFNWLSLLRHFEPLNRGQVNTSDLAYYVIISSLFVLFTVRRLESERVN
jgi:ABC-2 type transport system permease protein